jgi:hypothetical protein
MKTQMNMLVICLVFAMMLGGFSSVLAQQGHEPLAESKVTVPATVEDILANVDLQLSALNKVIMAKELDRVHVLAFEIRDMLMALPQRSDLPAPGKAALMTSLNNIKQQATLLDKFGDAKNLAQTKKVFTKFEDEIGKIKEILNMAH